ncbi:hypothetical protein WN55_08040 [Dufourea novaeangliae]|uniref:Uncharacterized protein n=1 Tax=Dufourea novaeangliae TaxID=178035 RepID=A0A154P975_DUFNO|nr:hypothetical protein WN55_08040 [Dufourea novaeangliae]
MISDVNYDVPRAQRQKPRDDTDVVHPLRLSRLQTEVRAISPQRVNTCGYGREYQTSKSRRKFRPTANPTTITPLIKSSTAPKKIFERIPPTRDSDRSSPKDGRSQSAPRYLFIGCGGCGGAKFNPDLRLRITPDLVSCQIGATGERGADRMRRGFTAWGCLRKGKRRGPEHRTKEIAIINAEVMRTQQTVSRHQFSSKEAAEENTQNKVFNVGNFVNNLKRKLIRGLEAEKERVS